MSRPTVITSETVSLLVTAFHNGLSVRQACWQSGISHEAYYSRLRSDPEFTDIMERAQNNLSINARTNVANAINNGDTAMSKWWLDRRDRDDFTTKTDVLVGGPVVSIPLLTEEEAKEELDRLIERRQKIAEAMKHSNAGNPDKILPR